MKKTTLLVFMLMLSITSHSYAQINFGARAGLNLASGSWGTLDAGETSKMIASFHIGPIIEFNVAEGFYLESGIFLSGKGSKIDVNFTETIFGNTKTETGFTKITPLYIEIPINALYKIDLNGAYLHLFAGPYFGFGVGGNLAFNRTYTQTGTDPYTIDTTRSINFGSDSTNCDMKGFDFGINLGLGVEYNNFLFKLQYGLGISNLSLSSDEKKSFNNAVIGISVGYLFGDGGGSGSKRGKHKRRR